MHLLESLVKTGTVTIPFPYLIAPQVLVYGLQFLNGSSVYRVTIYDFANLQLY